MVYMVTICYCTTCVLLVIIALIEAFTSLEKQKRKNKRKDSNKYCR